jgi:hypothetical protein
MNMKHLLCVAALGLTPLSTFAQGNLFITGHDTDDHGNEDYMRAGLDYLFFGAAATPAQALTRTTYTVGYLGNSNGGTSSVSLAGYTPTFIDLDNASWTTTAFAAGAFDALMIGSGFDFVSSAGSLALNGQASAFASYFNAGGSIFVNTEQGIGQSFYNFLPTFGVAGTNSIGTSGVFSTTAAGLAIGLTEAIVDADITHTTFTGVPAFFTTFETYNPTGAAVAIGLRNTTIDNGGFIPGDGTSAVPEPSTYGLMGAAALLAAVAYRRRAAKKQAAQV